nr:bifunctional adenosylcobinamide kinase/adenosylcobinamide-phosphate guanylyltransferase [Deinobacterium chartae]
MPLEELHVPRLSLLTGGARSGKSGRAERLAERLAARAGLAVSVIVTAQAFDDEMRERIRRHRADRPSHWTTLEAPHDPLAALAGAQGVVLLDCLSLWVSNRMLQGAGEAVILEQARALAAALRERPAPAVAVTNEVGSGIVPDNALARAYRDVLGRVNATVASAADLVALCAAGEATALRGDARWLHQRPE